MMRHAMHAPTMEMAGVFFYAPRAIEPHTTRGTIWIEVTVVEDMPCFESGTSLPR